MKTQQQASPTKQFNPYDLNEIAEVERVIKKRPLLKFQQQKVKHSDKHKIQRGILNPNNNGQG